MTRGVATGGDTAGKGNIMAREPLQGAGGVRLPASDDQTFDEAVRASDQQAFEQAAPTEAGDGAGPQQQAPAVPERDARHVPISELLDERDKRRALEARLAKFEEEERSRKTQEQPPDPFSNPGAFADQRIQAALAPVLQPLYQHMAQTNRQLAIAQYGQEAVDAAMQTFDGEWSQGRMDRAENFRVMSQPNPFAAAVKWHKDRLALAEVGDDPVAYRKRLLEEALNDPEFLGRAIEVARTQGARRPVTAAPQRTQAQPGRAQPPPRPNGGLPPSINRQGPPGGEQPLVTDLGDDDLYAEMTNPSKLGE